MSALFACPRPIEWMEYSDGAIDSRDEIARLRAHLAACARCRSTLETLRETDSAVRAADPAGSGPMPIESFLAAVKRRAADAPANAPAAAPAAPARRRVLVLPRLAIVGLAAAAAAVVATVIAIDRSGEAPRRAAESPSPATTPVAAAAGTEAPQPLVESRSIAPEPAAVLADAPLPVGLPDAAESAAFAGALDAARGAIRDAAATSDAATRDAALGVARAAVRDYPSLAPRLLDDRALVPAETVAALAVAADARDPLVVPAIERAIDDATDSATREAGFAALAAIRSSRAIDALSTRAARSASDDDTALGALRALARVAADEPRALDALADIARDAAIPGARRAVALGEIARRDSAAADGLLLALVVESPDAPGVSDAAAARREPLLRALQAALDRARGEDRAPTLAALGRLGDASLVPFLDRLARRGERSAEEAASVLGAMAACDASVDLLVRLRGDSSPRVRAAAAGAIARLGDAVVGPAERALDGPCATGAIGALADAGTPAAIAALGRALERPATAVAAADGLVRVAAPEALEVLAAGARSGSVPCRRALARRPEPEAAAALLGPTRIGTPLAKPSARAPLPAPTPRLRADEPDDPGDTVGAARRPAVARPPGSRRASPPVPPKPKPPRPRR